MVAEVFAVVAGETDADAVVVVENGGDSVEPEAVQFVLFHVEGEVGQQEAQHFVLGVVEEH